MKILDGPNRKEKRPNEDGSPTQPPAPTAELTSARAPRLGGDPYSIDTSVRSAKPAK